MADDNEYPRAMYHPDGGYRVVASADEESSLGGDWGRDPADVHRQSAGITIPRVDVSGKDDLAETIARRVVEMLRDELAPSDQPAGDQPSTDAAPRRGRPPGSRNRSIEEDNTNGE